MKYLLVPPSKSTTLVRKAPYKCMERCFLFFSCVSIRKSIDSKVARFLLLFNLQINRQIQPIKVPV